ncbi:Isopentenyl phosphate kinase [Seminavis robusta]|uniref:Isopentenyl phosphate kinase n=1 Tax=Seminavis robusta TaxID=568900 RepID=A0A9N8DFP2_9STRA|nr:Isopentenyl phosphate kinase [Seminavis robusta]|eukprot:Sro128_g061050.1 Isopentenyl phosphate kinase (396) ;mRNA; r:9927-11436
MPIQCPPGPWPCFSWRRSYATVLKETTTRLAIWCCCSSLVQGTTENQIIDSLQDEEILLTLEGDELEVVLVKIGGSSLTHKAQLETVDSDALQWFSNTIKETIHEGFKAPPLDNQCEDSVCVDSDMANADKNSAFNSDGSRRKRRAFIIVHGAGSFGHHTAKEYALKGQFQPPPTGAAERNNIIGQTGRRWTMQGLAKTRLSVQTLNRLVVSSLVKAGVNAVAISPCFGIPRMQAHGGATEGLVRVVRDTLQAGLVPVLHGDACLYGTMQAGILSGDILMEQLGQCHWVGRAIFLTDVDGVFTRDPRVDPHATLLKHIQVDKDTLDIISPVVTVTGSSHEHDVTGGLKTKLASAATIAASGTNVTIVKCGTIGAERVLLAEHDDTVNATTVYSGP